MLAKGLKIFRNHLLPKVKKTFLNLFLHTMRESTYRIVTRAEKRASQRSNQSYEMITHRAINERHWFFRKTWAVKIPFVLWRNTFYILLKPKWEWCILEKPNPIYFKCLSYSTNLTVWIAQISFQFVCHHWQFKKHSSRINLAESGK